MIYVQWVLAMAVLAWVLAHHAPIRVSFALWLVMMCWELYDLHPDHVVAYSVALLGPVLYRISFRGVQWTPVPSGRTNRRTP